MRDRIWTVAIGVALVALVAWSAWQRWQTLATVPFPLGVDGYFYPIQVRSLLEHGTLHYPASPLTFWWMAPFAAATDPITGAKLGAAIGCALVGLPAFGVAYQLTRQRGAALVAAAVATTASTSAYLTSEYVKQGIGLTVALTTIWLLLRALATPTRTRIGLALAGLFATALTHKLAAGVVLAIAIPASFEEARARGVLRGRRLLYLIAIGVLLAITLLVIGLVAPRRFLSPDDLALLGHLFSSTARWDAPALVMSPTLSLTFDHEAALGGGVALVAAVLVCLRRVGEREQARRSGGHRAVTWSFIVLAVVIALPWLAVIDPQGLGFRLRVTAFVPLAICAAVVASAIARLIEAAWRDAALVALAVVIARAPHSRDEGRVVPHPAMVSAVMAAATKIPKDVTLIVPERQILFMATWYLRVPVVLRPEHVPYGRRLRMLPGNFVGLGSPLDKALTAVRADPRLADPPIGLHARVPNGLVLVPEPAWDYALALVPAEYRGWWARWRTI